MYISIVGSIATDQSGGQNCDQERTAHTTHPGTHEGAQQWSPGTRGVRNGPKESDRYRTRCITLVGPSDAVGLRGSVEQKISRVCDALNDTRFTSLIKLQVFYKVYLSFLFKYKQPCNV